jgi:sortase (surface protein transpeptidase)
MDEEEFEEIKDKMKKYLFLSTCTNDDDEDSGQLLRMRTIIE